MSTTPPERPAGGGPSKGRVEAFSDGVFAVAITLLVLNITLDRTAERGHLWSDLGQLKYQYAAYAISFLTIGIMWVSHHNLMTNVIAVDHALLYRNLLLLGVICFIPFPTGILSEYVHGQGGTNMRAAVGLYGITLIALSVAFTLLWIHVYRTPAIRAPWITQTDIRTDTIRSSGSVLIYVVATALSPVEPVVALVIFAVLVVVFALARPRPQPLQVDS